jgi:hypothetical protein
MAVISSAAAKHQQQNDQQNQHGRSTFLSVEDLATDKENMLSVRGRQDRRRRIPAATPTPASTRVGWRLLRHEDRCEKGKLVYSTYLGGADVEDDIHIAVDRRGRAYLAGTTESSDFPEVNPIAGASSGLFQRRG